MHQLDLANRYYNAHQTLQKPDLGGYIDQLEWFTQQPEFADKPYAEVAALLSDPAAAASGNVVAPALALLA